ncbi:MAG TPA: methyltransferase domain-containing protein [Gaiellaceae bacterium]
MTFTATRGAYDAFMGRYADRLAPLLIAFAGVQRGERVLDVGCGPGSLTEALGQVVGPEQVAAVEPSEPFAAATAERVPDAEVQVGAAESLPWAADTFDVALAQLVVNFMSDADAGVAEMRRVVHPGGTVAACTWDYSGGMTMLRTFWDAALSLDPDTPDEARTMRYNDPDVLQELWLRAGLKAVENDALVVEVAYTGFDDYWEPFTGGVGPAGAYTSSLDADRRAALREECRRRLGDPDGAFTLSAKAWAVKGRA